MDDDRYWQTCSVERHGDDWYIAQHRYDPPWLDGPFATEQAALDALAAELVNEIAELPDDDTFEVAPDRGVL